MTNFEDFCATTTFQAHRQTGNASNSLLNAIRAHASEQSHLSGYELTLDQVPADIAAIGRCEHVVVIPVSDKQVSDWTEVLGGMVEIFNDWDGKSASAETFVRIGSSSWALESSVFNITFAHSDGAFSVVWLSETQWLAARYRWTDLELSGVQAAENCRDVRHDLADAGDTSAVSSANRLGNIRQMRIRDAFRPT